LEFRLKLESFPVLAAPDLKRKQTLLRQAEEATVMTRLMCDLLVGAALSTTTGEPPQEDDAFSRKRGELWRQLMETYRYDEDVDSWCGAMEAMRPTARQLLDVGLRPGSSKHRTFHWPLEFPEVFINRDGFDAIVGNPPFMGGQKITGALGTRYRDYLVSFVAAGTRGSADLSAYFFLRANSLLRATGHAGLITTSTIAQGDTREVGLEQLFSAGMRIPRAVSSRTWPGEATVFYSAVWLCHRDWIGDCILDDKIVSGITPALRPTASVAGSPFRLAANERLSFIGSYVLGMGFVLEPDAAYRLIERNSGNRDVVFPYLNGEDLNARPDQSASRWVINFHDWPEERAREYEDCFEIVERLVRPEREKVNRKVRRERWWQFAERATELYRSIAGMDRILGVSLITNHVCFAFLPSTWVFAHKLAILPLGSDGHLALLQSSLHYAWAWEYSSTNLALLNYSPSDCFKTFPFPSSVESLREIGLRYGTYRREVMLSRGDGLTLLYNRFHSPHEVSQDIATLRALHVEMDHAVAAAYDWTDLDLGHGFHQAKQGIRYTISEAARRKILDLLLALNHDRYAAEQSGAAAAPRPKARGRKPAPEQTGLF
jgi:hypothetical protein